MMMYRLIRYSILLIPYSSTSPRLSMRARSTLRIVSRLNFPRRRMSRCRSIERIWLRRTTELTWSPPSGVLTRTSVG